ncbi:MAG TPA: hypothetical protein VKK31_03995 [Thermoanaerobaculia bacterium]|nr:hypothetical protein [Thermoanaerobaculia bacterium]
MTGTAALSREERRPPRRLPLLYFGFAHLCLAAAFAAVALDPRGVAGFFYHPRMVAIVHLVTLGWITASILGAVYMIGPMALRMPMPARAADYWAFGLFVAGVSGMVIHFWIAEPWGMAWAAGMVTLALLRVALRVLRALAAAPIQRAVKLHFALGFLNLLGAAAAGLLLGLDKARHFLPGYVLANVAAHAHLAALGWALMIVMGAGYRLLPMLLPAAMPDRSSLWPSALLLEAGVLGLFAGLVARRPWAGVFAVLVAAGIAAFLREVHWMVRHPRPAPKDLRRPDLGVVHVAQALACLILAAILGLVLVFSPDGAWKMTAIMVYGVLGLVGFLAQMVIGVNARLLPLFSWLTAYAGDGFRAVPPSPHAIPSRAIQWWTLGLWSAGVPLLAAGLALDRTVWLTAAGWALLAAVVLNGIGAFRVVWLKSRTRRLQGESPAR